MYRFFTALAALLLVVGTPATAKTYTVRTVPNVQLAAANRFVSNPDGILSPEAVHTIDTMLYRLKTDRLAQVAVVAVESIGDADPREFAHELLNEWGLGESGQDNGLMVLLVLDQGAIEIETGYGIEGDLPDALCKRIITNMMLPAFRERDFDRGMTSGVSAMAAVLSGRELPAELTADNDEMPFGAFLGFIGFLVLMILGLAWIVKRANRCPKCKKGTLKRSGDRILISDTLLRKTYKTAYVCPLCGHTVWRNETIDKGGGGIGGPIIGGGFGRGGFGGGGFGGGGWGGGHSGGGGAGGRF